jgi:glutaredoxin 2
LYIESLAVEGVRGDAGVEGECGSRHHLFGGSATDRIRWRGRSAMGSREKVRQFLEESEAHRHYEGIVDYALTYLVAKAEKEGKTQFAADLNQMKGEYKEDFAKAVALTEEVFSDIFDDEELDNLIVLHSNPAIKKMRGLNSEIVGKVLRKYSQVSGVRLPENL